MVTMIKNELSVIQAKMKQLYLCTIMRKVCMQNDVYAMSSISYCEALYMLLQQYFPPVSCQVNVLYSANYLLGQWT